MTLAWFERWAGVLGGAAAVLVLAGLWLFFQEREDYEQRDLRGRTQLIVAAEEGDLERVEYLLEQNVRVDAGDDCQWTAMMRAAAGGHSDILVRLLDQGADINHREKSGYTALMGAAVNNRLETAQILVERGADLDIQETESGQTALMWGVRNRNPDMVRLLLSAGADTSLTNRQGQSVRDLALQASAGEPSARLEEIREVLGCQP
ncbi:MULTISPECIES: ankyrin repeat domain-containing protein [Marinobacter]|uniref:ankyrin repeat domain-containing protein n=1 Tax=Marinobacter TaxID=2742 RepID=UPI001FE2138A|nr:MULTISPECIES: ankyrin repeat domain-containing protein [Marinobacter]UZD67719.1 ankyrin repeat domain-containing protein [Marinobacter sp. AN1]